MMCEHSLWSNNPAELTCEGNQTASFSKAKSLEVNTNNIKHARVITETIKMISKEEMGARANKKLIEMRTKEDFDKPVMKTKVQ